MSMTVTRFNEVDFRKLVLSRSNFHNDGFSSAFIYDGEPLCVQLPLTRCVFGLITYTNPQNIMKRRVSTGLCMDGVSDLDKYVHNFMTFVDSFARTCSISGSVFEFVPCVKVNKRGQSHLRIKIPQCDRGDANIELYLNGKFIVNPSLVELTNWISHDRKIEVIIQLCPLWYSGSKCGVSWKLKCLKVDTVGFS